MRIDPSQKLICTVISRKFTFIENLLHISNSYSNWMHVLVFSCSFSYQKVSVLVLFLLFLEMECLGKVRPSRTKTCQSRPCVRQPWQCALKGFWLQKCIRDYAKAMPHFRICLKFSLQQFVPSHCSRSPFMLFLCNSFQWLISSRKCSQYFPGFSVSYFAWLSFLFYIFFPPDI